MALIIGDAGNNSLPGTAEADQIRGLDGNDRIEGRAGNDILEGGRGRDTIYGGTGRDILIGGLGRDIMYGGPGPDTFRFDDKDTGDVSASLADVIHDFGPDDIIDLVAVDVVGISGGVQPERGMFSLWESEGDTYITWNTFGAYHDIVLTGVTGVSLSQIRWYEDDYLASRFTTGRLAAGGMVGGTIEKTQDADWFRITLDESQLYTFELKGEPSGSGTLDDPHVALYDSSGNLVAENYDVGNTLDAQLKWNPDSSGVYYVSADGSGYTTGTYKLEVASQPYSDDYPDNQTTTGTVELGEVQQGEIELAGDGDWFRIELEEGVEYSIEVQGQSSGAGSLRDPYVIVYDEFGSWWDSDDNGGPRRDAELLFTAGYSGTWYIAAHANDGGTGTYEVSVSLL